MQIAVLKKPERKIRKWPFVVLIVFLLLTILPVVIIYVVLYDANTKQVHIQNDVTLKTAGNRVMVDSLDHTLDHETMEIIVNENDMDNILHVGLKKAVGQSTVVKKAYMYVNKDRYNFYIDLDGNIIKTRIKVYTLLEESQDKSAFIFKIKDIALGNASGLTGPLKDIINKYINYETVNRFVQSAGLTIEFNPDTMSMTYSKANIVKDIEKLTNNSSNGLYFDIMDTMLKDNLVAFETATNNFMEAYVDLTKLQTNELVTDDSDHLKIQADEVSDQVRDNLIYLANNNLIPTDEASLKTGFKYLFGGWNYINEEEQNVIKDIDMSTIGIDNNEEYKGFDLMDVNAKLFEKMKDTVDVDALVNDHSVDLCSLTEQQINEYLAGRNIVGYTTLLHRQIGEEHKINYITIDNFYMNIYTPLFGDRVGKRVAEMVCKINVNGYHTSLTFDTLMEGESAENNCLTFDIQKINFGSTAANNLTEQFFSIIYDALNKNSNDSSLRADKENHTITLDFNEIIDYAKERVQEKLDEAGQTADLDTTFATANINFDIVGASREDAGDMILTLKEPIQVS